ncbi:MAG: L-threonine 3-dehydrogenase [Pseudomonadota bacterium]
MRALVKSKPETGIWLQDVSVPTIGPNDVLVKVKKAAICGTDVHIYNWDDWSQRNVPTPMTIGHEFMGEIVEIGSEVHPEHASMKVGDRVSVEGHVTCGYCRNCRAGKRHLCRNTEGIGVSRPGAFAEYIAAPAFNVYKLPSDIADELGAIFDPFGNAVHTALAFDLVGEDVLITGAGPIGIMAAAVARFVGARNVVVSDLNPYRLKLAEKLGATHTIDPTKTSLRELMASIGMTEGFDVGLEMSGAPIAFESMLESMNHGGRIAMLGIMPNGAGVDWDQIIFKGLEIKGIYGRRMFETWYKMGSLLQAGLDLSPIVTHRFPASSYLEAFETMRSGQSGKVILDFAAPAWHPETIS